MKISFMYVRRPGKIQTIAKEVKTATVNYIIGVEKPTDVFFSKVDAALFHLKPYRAYLALGYAVALVILPAAPVLAASAAGGLKLLQLFQKASFWVGLGITIWGVIEMQLDLPGWKGRIFKGFVGYVLVLILPLIFLSIQDALLLDEETIQRLSK
jgi:hypothetical protein